MLGLGVTLAVGGTVVIIGTHFVWIVTDAEYAKHADTAYAFGQSIKYIWWAYIITAIGGILTWMGWD